MRRITLESDLGHEGYETPLEALIAAQKHPLVPKARATTEQLCGSIVSGIAWAQSACEFVFDSGVLLRIEARDREFVWTTTTSPNPSIVHPLTPVEIQWKSEIEVYDPRPLGSYVLDGEFVQLLVNDIGLHFYTRNQLILVVRALRICETREDFLYVMLDD